jgi:hypothetical protein
MTGPVQPDPEQWGPPLTPAEAEALAGAAEALASLPPTEDLDDMTEPPAKGGTQASQLVALAEHRYRIVQGVDGRAYAVDRHGPAVALSLRGRDGLRTRLARHFYDTHHQTPSGSALSDAVTVLEGTPMQPEPVALRIARTPHGAIVVDLGDAAGSAVVVDAGGWQIVDCSPVLFRRTALTSPIAAPVRGGTLDPLRELINVDDAGFRLIIGWLVAALFAEMPHPILALIGEQGTAKSTAAQLVVSLIDPSPAPLRTPPRDIRSWAVSASASGTVALDNISVISPWFSDTLCKAVTGDGIVDRALFTDDDVSVLTFRRCIALTSIDAGRLAGDLAERLLPVELARITPDRRRPDAEITSAYDRARPLVLGALFDLAAGVLAALPTVHLDELPRMADFARTLAALDHVTGWTTLADYTSAAAETTTSVVEADPLAQAIAALVAAGPWSGTAAELLDRITPEHPPRDWPTNARKIAGDLRRLAPALRGNGVAVDFVRSTDGARRRLVTLSSTARSVRADSGPSGPSEPSEGSP